MTYLNSSTIKTQSQHNSRIVALKEQFFGPNQEDTVAFTKNRNYEGKSTEQLHQDREFFSCSDHSSRRRTSICYFDTNKIQNKVIPTEVLQLISVLVRGLSRAIYFILSVIYIISILLSIFWQIIISPVAVCLRVCITRHSQPGSCSFCRNCDSITTPCPFHLPSILWPQISVSPSYHMRQSKRLALEGIF